MEREVSLSIHIGVMLIMLAALISIVWYTVRMGRSVEDLGYSSGSKIVSTVESSQLNSIKGTTVTIPKVAAYNIITKENSCVTKLIYYKSNDPRQYIVTAKNGGYVVSPTITFTDKFGGTITKSSFTFIQDILAEQMYGKVQMYAEPNGDSTYTVTIFDNLT